MTRRSSDVKGHIHYSFYKAQITSRTWCTLRTENIERLNNDFMAQPGIVGEWLTSISIHEIVTLGTSVAARIRLLVVTQVLFPFLLD